MEQGTTPTYRILTRKQRHRRNWHTHRISKTHQVAYDPGVYAGVIFLLFWQDRTGSALVEPEAANWPFLDVVPTDFGHDLGLVRAAS